MNIDWQGILGTALETLVFSAVSAAALYFITWIKVKKQELAKKLKDEAAKKYLDMLEKTITDCVMATNQTYVKALKDEGIFNEEAQKTAFQKTYDAVAAVLTEDAQKYLSESVKDLETYITNKIEAQVGKLK